MVLSLEELTCALDSWSLLPFLCSVFPFSVILWLGDLNYRVEELDVEKVKQLVEEKAFQELCQYDQVPLPYLLARGRLETVRPFSSIWELALSLLKMHVFVSFLLIAKAADG